MDPASQASESRLVEIVYPENTNSQGTLFGGHALSLMDRLAFIVASRHTRLPIVTASSEKVEFRLPVKEGDLIDLVGHVTRVGRTSLVVSIDMYREGLLTGRRDLCTTGEFIMVAVDAEGQPTPIGETS